MEKRIILERVREMAEAVLREHNAQLVDISYRKEGGNYVLRVLADTESGITLDECAAVNNSLSVLLDEAGFLESSYLLEVSSPGLDRPLKTKTDFTKAVGKRIVVHTYAPLAERKDFTGTVKSIDEDGVRISQGSGEEYMIPLDAISKATLDYKNMI